MEYLFSRCSPSLSNGHPSCIECPPPVAHRQPLRNPRPAHRRLRTQSRRHPGFPHIALPSPSQLRFSLRASPETNADPRCQRISTPAGPRVPAIHHVVNRSLILDSQLAWHGPPRSQNPENTSIVISDPFSTPFLNIKDINEGTTLSIPSGFPSIKPKWLQNLIKPRSNRLGIHGS